MNPEGRKANPLNAEGPILGGRTLLILGVTLLSCFVLLLAGLAADRARVGQLEVVKERTSVGDNEFFPIPANREAAVAILQGQPLFVVDVSPVKIRDGKMRRAGEDETTQRSIYQLRETADEWNEKANSFFLKTERDRYLEAQPQGEMP